MKRPATFHFAQYYHDSTGWNGTDFSGPVQTIRALGSDGVCPVDGRRTSPSQLSQAQEHALRLINCRTFTHVRIFRSQTGRYSDGVPTSPMVPILYASPLPHRPN